MVQAAEVAADYCCLLVTDAVRTCPEAAMKALLNSTPPHVYMKREAVLRA